MKFILSFRGLGFAPYRFPCMSSEVLSMSSLLFSFLPDRPPPSF